MSRARSTAAEAAAPTAAEALEAYPATGLTALARTIRRPLERLAAVPGGSFIILRAFLGFTFTFAGVQKLTDRYFFQASAPGSIQSQLLASTRSAPWGVHYLVTAADHAPVLVGLMIAFGEIAVGLGTLVGLFSRLAALGGAALSFSFFLTVSFHASPYYYGADLAFFFAWTGLVINGAGRWSLDAMLAEVSLRERVAIGAAKARASAAERRQIAEVDRRRVLRQGFAAASVAALGVVLAGLGVVLGRLIPPAHPVQATTGSFGPGSSSAGTTTTTPSGGGSTTTTPSGGGTTTTTPGGVAPPKGTKLGAASVVPVGGAASFTDPAQQIPAYVVQPSKGQYSAFSGVCTHAGCTVEWDAQGKDFVCPCHGSVYNGATGAVINGPAVNPLPPIKVVDFNGELYVDG